VLIDDRPVALSWVGVDLEHRRAEHELTGTARAYRRRGLARLAKLAALRWCAAHGIERLATGNDGENAGMLAINYELGFRPDAVEIEWAKRA
jgi:GNAT superfamily N-acetyltransferase